MTTNPTACKWLVRVPSGNPEPDSIEDTYKDVECGDPNVDYRALCGYHAAAMDMDVLEFEALSEQHDGLAFS